MKLYILLFLVVITFIFESCRSSPIRKINPTKLEEDMIVFRGTVMERKYSRVVKERIPIPIAGLIDNEMYKGGGFLEKTDTIRLTWQEMAHGSLSFHTSFEYFVIAKPSKYNYYGITIYTPVNVMINAGKQETNFKKETEWWKKYKRDKASDRSIILEKRR